MKEKKGLDKIEAMERFSIYQWEYLMELLKISFDDPKWEGELFPTAHPVSTPQARILDCSWRQKYCLSEEEWGSYLKIPGKTWLMNSVFNTLFPKFTVGGTHLFVKKSKDEFGKILSSMPFDSAVGHESTVAILNNSFGVDCHPGFVVDSEGNKKMKRKNLDINSPSDIYLAAIVRPGYRLPEGVLWTPEELERMDLDYYAIVPVKNII